jgi:hypothetical protein
MQEFMQKEVFKVEFEFPPEMRSVVEESFSDALKSIQLSLKFLVAQRLVEKKGLDERQGERLAKEIRAGVARRVLG